MMHDSLKTTQADEQNQTNRNIYVLGWVAFFGGLSQDIISPVLPTFYASVLGLSKETIGLIEGSITTIVSLFKIISGFMSDRLGKRKSIVFIGYALSAIGRVFLSITSGAGFTFLLRAVDGLGKGLKDAPRDALIAKSAKKSKMGFSFGLQRTLDTLGSFVGPLITSYLLLHFAHLGNVKRYQLIFLIAGLIAFITIILIYFFVKEQETAVMFFLFCEQKTWV